MTTTSTTTAKMQRRRSGDGDKDCCATTPTTTTRRTITSTTVSAATIASTTSRRWRAVLIGLSLLHHASTNATITCPPGESPGNFPSSDCTQFGWCDGTSSQAVGVQSCAPGTLFNNGMCDWASNVDCGATPSPTPPPTTNVPTKKPTATPTMGPVSSGGRPANYCECVPLGTTTGSYIKCCSDQGTCNSPGEILCPAPQACLADYYIDFSVDDPFDLCQLQEEEVTPTPKPTKAPTATPKKAPTVNPTEAPTQSPILVGDPTASPTTKEAPTHIPTNAPTTKAPTKNPATTNGDGTSGERKTIIGYYASWQWYDRNKLAAPENMDFTKVTRVNFAFFQTDVNGNIWGTDSWADPNLLFGPYNWNPQPGSPTYCSWDAPPAVKSCNSHYHEEGLISLVHAAGAEIYPSIGGWTLSDAFPPMAASPTARAHFATKCAELVQEYDFDGIDLDWEYPGFADNSGTPEDTVNFNLLLDEIRAKLDGLTAVTGKEYGLTAALPCGPHLIRNIDIGHVANVLSELNLMTYDFHGAFSETTGVNAPVYDQGWGDPEPGWSVHGCTQNWLDGGGSRSKINIGLPFYGRSFKSATELNQHHTGADMQAWHWDDGTPQYFNILDQLSSMTTVRHEPTKTQYAYFNDESGLVSYDDERAICDKTEYAIDHELNGFIIWELSGDMLSDFSTPLLDMVNKKLADPNMACGPPGAAGSTPAPQNTPQTSAPPTKSPTAVTLTKTAPPSKSPTLPAASPTKTPTVSSISTSNEPTMSPVAVSVGGTSDVPTKSPTSSSTGTTSNAPTRSPTVSSQGSTSPTARPTEEDGSGTNGGGFYNGQITYSCGDESNQNLAGAVELDIHYDYEVHTPTNIDLLDGLRDLKSSVLDDLAQRINCIRSSERRKMSANKGKRMAMVEDAVVGMSSKNADDPDQGVCSINVEPDVATTCTPMEGLVTVFLEAGSSPSTIAEVKNELLFHVRTGMSAGRYESDKVAKVIYIAEGNAGTSDTDPSVPGEIQSREDDDSGGVSSVTLGVVAFVLAALLAAALAAYLFVKRKDRSKRNRIEEADIEQLPQKVEWYTAMPSNMLPKRDLSGTSYSPSTESHESDINVHVFESSKVSSTSTETPGGASIFSSVSSSSQPSTFTFSSSNVDDTIPKRKRRRSEGGTQSFVFKPPSPPIPSSASAAGTSEAPTEPSDEPQRTSSATELPTMPPPAPTDANPSLSFAANTTTATSKSPSAAIFVFGSGETTASSDAASSGATGLPATVLNKGGLGEDGERSSDHISSLEALAYLASPSKKNNKSLREDFPSELDTLDGID